MSCYINNDTIVYLSPGPRPEHGFTYSPSLHMEIECGIYIALQNIETMKINTGYRIQQTVKKVLFDSQHVSVNVKICWLPGCGKLFNNNKKLIFDIYWFEV